ncbi:MAG: NAD(P)H-hydrate dehydratase [Actinobacteria bacterium]|nr:NAD(P)H-hydrate dehydratase [Actinomycetota bacterium]MCA1721275.1 NAD(P)H-hydrate dehydratase [Actinomycetota bacterium]
MRAAHTVADIRAAEAAVMATLPEGTLMQRAAAGLAVACAQRLGRVYGARIVLLVGSGNNGADALWAGARLARRGAAVTAVAVGEPVPDALAALLAAGGRVGVLSALDEADLVVDGIVGIGGRGGLRDPSLAVQGEHVVAVDLPSGVDADTGAVPGPAVRAGLTVTFGTDKPGLHVGAGKSYAGRLELVDIGLGPWLSEPAVRLLDGVDVALALPDPDAASDKFRRGVLGVAAGSAMYGGAAVLAVGAGIRSGAGMVRYAGHAADAVRARWPEAVVTETFDDAGQVQAWVVGPGLGTDAAAAAVVEAVLAQDVPVLVDADALTVCAQHQDWLKSRSAPTLLTPHDREFGRFGSDVGSDRVGAARRLAAELGVTVLLKGDATVVTDGRAVYVNDTGSAVLATAGSGDVLSGGTGSLLAQGLDPLTAGAVGAHLHGVAGTVSAEGAATSAFLVLEAWPKAVRAVRAGTLDG